MKLIKAILFFYSLNLVIVVIIWSLFGAEVKPMLTAANTYLLPLIITSVGLFFGLGVPFLLYSPNRKAIFVWSQIIATVLFCSFVVKVCFDEGEAQKEYEMRKNKLENVIREF